MASVKFPVNPDVLRWAIEASDCDVYALAEKFPKLDSWLSKDDMPTFKQLESLSKKLHIPLGYIILDTPPVEKIELLEFRTIENGKITKPSRELIDTIYAMQERQEWMREYMISEDEDPLDYIASISKDTECQRAAKKIRKDLEIDENWYLDFNSAHDEFVFLRERLEQKGIVVMVSGIVGNNTHRSLSLDEFRAFAIVDNYAPLIFVNSKDSKHGRLFSLCHEVAHLWFGENSLYNDNGMLDSKYRSGLEVKCNAIAAELLVPNGVFVKKWLEIKGEYKNKVEELSKTFNVSAIVIARRALDNNFITKEQYLKISYEISKIVNQIKKSDGGDYYNTARFNLDNRFFKAVNRSLKQGRTAFTEAYRLTGLNGKSYDKMESLIGD